MNRLRLLIVDDSPIIQARLISMIGEVGGFDIVGVGKTGSEAIDGVAALLPDILVLDIAMPGGGGFGVLEALKQRRDAPLIIVLTNHPDYRQRSLEAGADYFIDKSAGLDQFLLLLECLKPDSGVDFGRRSAPPRPWHPM